MASVLYNIIIAPIELVVEVVFELIWRLVGQRETNQGLALIGVSLAISLLTLPLYRRADAVQQRERDLQKKLSYWVQHIKKTFKGDERFMMLQTYYRENGYSPLHALNGSISLLLEIPFFMAAYHFLSHLEAIRGVAFGPIANLGQPDALIRIGGFSLNLLPILMTAINCISAAVYLKGFPPKAKIQTYGMALIFLVLLYNSPSGLVVYWTCNNIFSLVKNVFYRLKNPRKAVALVCALAGIALGVLLFASGILNSAKKYISTVLLMLFACLPLVLRKVHILKPREKANALASIPGGKNLFIASAMALTVLLGLLIPSGVIESSPAEFIDIGNYRNPLLLIATPFCLALGFFCLWPSVFYAIGSARLRRVVPVLFFFMLVSSLVDYFLFSGKLGILSSTLVFDNDPEFSAQSSLLNAIVLATMAVLFAFLLRKKLPVLIASFFAIVIFVVSVSAFVVNAQKTRGSLKDMSYIVKMEKEEEVQPILTLSQTEKNVVVIMLDRAISGFFPLILEEKPELKEQFAGFTYYPNTISFGMHTIFGSPPLFGGYEYVPKMINKRSDELLVEKQNQALKLLPSIFSDTGYYTTVCDLPFANGKYVPDLSIFEDIPRCKAYHTIGLYSSAFTSSDSNKDQKRNFFCYAVFKVAPVFMRTAVYDGGDYYSSKTDMYATDSFINNYSVLAQLAPLTAITQDNVGSFIALSNDTTHNPCRLYLPDYTPEPTKEEETPASYTFKTVTQRNHYHVNMAALLQLGKWFDFLRKNGVWNNTRIIIASDHGKTMGRGTEGLGFFDYMLMKNPEIDISTVNPLLLVKDFNSLELSTDHRFMTQADVPSLALEGIVEAPVNPFTGTAVTMEEKYAHPQFITSSHNHGQLNTPGLKTFDTSDGKWFTVHDDIFIEENWQEVK